MYTLSREALPFSPPIPIHWYTVHIYTCLVAMITLQAQFVQCNVGNWSCSENAFSFTYTGTSSDSGDSVLVSPALSQEATSVLCMELMALEICLYGATLSFSTAPMEVHTHTQYRVGVCSHFRCDSNSSVSECTK